MKHIGYFILGLIVVPFICGVFVYNCGKSAWGMFLEGYRRGVEKRKRKRG